MKVQNNFVQAQTARAFPSRRYEEEINKHTAAENEFVVLKKVGAQAAGTARSAFASSASAKTVGFRDVFPAGGGRCLHEQDGAAGQAGLARGGDRFPQSPL